MKRHRQSFNSIQPQMPSTKKFQMQWILTCMKSLRILKKLTGLKIFVFVKISGDATTSKKSN